MVELFFSSISFGSCVARGSKQSLRFGKCSLALFVFKLKRSINIIYQLDTGRPPNKPTGKRKKRTAPQNAEYHKSVTITIRIALRRVVVLLVAVLFVVPVLFLQLPHVLVRVLHVVVAHLLQDFLQVADRLPGDLYQIFDVIILVLFERVEQHVEHGVLVVPALFALRLLALPVLDVVLVVRHRFVVVHDLLERFHLPRRLGRFPDRFQLHLHVAVVGVRATLELLHDPALHVLLLALRHRIVPGGGDGVREHTQRLLGDDRHVEPVVARNLLRRVNVYHRIRECERDLCLLADLFGNFQLPHFYVARCLFPFVCHVLRDLHEPHATAGVRQVQLLIHTNSFTVFRHTVSYVCPFFQIRSEVQQ
uniref:Uncharacterized protein n=1 Tax=Anopheles atroparvus TaxID=41427 RepID=A0AAG5DE08_ANOAO